jgi:hypothetical protein
MSNEVTLIFDKKLGNTISSMTPTLSIVYGKRFCQKFYDYILLDFPSLGDTRSSSISLGVSIIAHKFLDNENIFVLSIGSLTDNFENFIIQAKEYFVQLKKRSPNKCLPIANNETFKKREISKSII